MVSAYSCPAPPLASTTAPARTRRGPPSLHSSAPVTRPSVVTRSTRKACSALRTAGAARTASVRARSSSAPVASPPAWTTRDRECPPSRVRASSPSSSPGRPVEADPAGAQVGDGLAALGGQHPDRHRVAQPGPGGQGVGHVLGHRVVDQVEHGRDPALGVAGGRVAEAVLGGQQHRQALRDGQGGRQPGHPGPDHQHVHLPRRPVRSWSRRGRPAGRAGSASGSLLGPGPGRVPARAGALTG